MLVSQSFSQSHDKTVRVDVLEKSRIAEYVLLVRLNGISSTSPDFLQQSWYIHRLQLDGTQYLVAVS